MCRDDRAIFHKYIGGKLFVKLISIVKTLLFTAAKIFRFAAPLAYANFPFVVFRYIKQHESTRKYVFSYLAVLIFIECNDQRCGFTLVDILSRGLIFGEVEVVIVNIVYSIKLASSGCKLQKAIFHIVYR